MDKALASGAATVMIVDDEFFFREMLRDVLVGGGFDVVAESSDGVEAVQKFRQHRPQLTVMDVFMPEMNGIDAIREIISIDPEAKIVIFTGMGFDDDVEFALKAGASDVVLKNYLPEEMIEVLNRVLSR
jgi:two-component system, chemotaxis family, chemotaxis protein CheY